MKRYSFRQELRGHCSFMQGRRECLMSCIMFCTIREMKQEENKKILN